MLDRGDLEQLARVGGAAALSHFRGGEIERKADASYVTEGDRHAERAIREEVRRRWPAVGFLGEELPEEGTDARYRLAIDPIDGTASFVAALPTWAVSVGLLEDGEPVAGAVYLPVVDEIYSADAGGAHWNGTPLSSLSPVPPDDPQTFILAHSTTHHHFRVRFPGKIRNLGSTAYHMAVVARGAALGALLGCPRIWDMAAGAALLRATGAGVYGLVTGRPLAFRPLLDGGTPTEPVVAVREEHLDRLRRSFEPLR